jgi:hypothetical protein
LRRVCAAVDAGGHEKSDCGKPPVSVQLLA